jgi:hypothetical protein
MANNNGGSGVSNRVKVLAAVVTTVTGVLAAMFTFGTSLLGYLQATSSESAPDSSAQSPRTEPEQSVSWASLQSVYFETFDSPQAAKDYWVVEDDEDWQITIDNGFYWLQMPRIHRDEPD